MLVFRMLALAGANSFALAIPALAHDSDNYRIARSGQRLAFCENRSRA
jgi:hypothetical protein